MNKIIPAFLVIAIAFCLGFMIGKPITFSNTKNNLVVKTNVSKPQPFYWEIKTGNAKLDTYINNLSKYPATIYEPFPITFNVGNRVTFVLDKK